MSFAEDIANDILGFVAEIEKMPSPAETLANLIQETHRRPDNPDAFASAILDFCRSATVDDFRNPANAPLLAPLVTVYGGPAEQQLGDELWGKGWGQKGRYERKASPSLDKK